MSKCHLSVKGQQVGGSKSLNLAQLCASFEMIDQSMRTCHNQALITDTDDTGILNLSVITTTANSAKYIALHILIGF